MQMAGALSVVGMFMVLPICWTATGPDIKQPLRSYPQKRQTTAGMRPTDIEGREVGSCTHDELDMNHESETMRNEL